MKKSNNTNLFEGEFIIDIINDKPINTKDFYYFQERMVFQMLE